MVRPDQDMKDVFFVEFERICGLFGFFIDQYDIYSYTSVIDFAESINDKEKAISVVAIVLSMCKFVIDSGDDGDTKCMKLGFSFYCFQILPKILEIFECKFGDVAGIKYKAKLKSLNFCPKDRYIKRISVRKNSCPYSL